MRVSVFPCGPAANESERKAVEYLKSRLQSEPGEGEWVLLTNLMYSVTNQLQSDEVDIVAIGPPGVRVIEVKHWTAAWVDQHKDLVDHEADRVTKKARKIGTNLRKLAADLPHVDAVFLLTEASAKIARVSGRQVRGVTFYPLKQWRDAVNLDAYAVLSAQQIKSLSRALAPKSSTAIDGSVRRLAGYVNLELQSPKDDRFHRIYKGIHSTRQDRVILHLYDLSASEEKNAQDKAKREFDALRRLQLYSWAPRILDSYQPVPGYDGEMFFFTVVDPAAPTIQQRTADPTWSASDRLAFARNTVRALQELHRAVAGDVPMVHRNLSPQTILVKHDNTPILTGFERTRIPSEVSVGSTSLPDSVDAAFLPPEVRAQGLAAADRRSDVFSLCASLRVLFADATDSTSEQAVAALDLGLAEDPNARISLDQLDEALAELLGESPAASPAPPARFWTEDQIVRFREHDYRIITRLGSGGVGTTFKVVQVDRRTREDLGTYVAKVAHNEEVGRRVLHAYKLVRSHLGHTGLSTVFEVAREWEENSFIALMKWVDGTALAAFSGVFPLLAEEQQEPSVEALAFRWIEQACRSLDVLHRSGLIHGDVSPRNMIVSGTDLVLTDYDFVCRIGEPRRAPGTVLYCSPVRQPEDPAAPSDDLYALAASFFHVVCEREPFRYDGNLDKSRGLNWEGVDRSQLSRLADWLDRATHPDPAQRFQTVRAALEFMRELRGADSEASPATAPPGTIVEEPRAIAKSRPSPDELTEQRVEWLQWLLQSYPGSRWGNRETRGLDSDFAAATYVPTPLEETLLEDIRQRRVRLVILCGNAGDGKTALLQHLALRMGLDPQPSASRILEGQVAGGPRVRINLDGSASWKGKSADELLDEFLAPFQDGPPQDDIVHLLAINDGRLLEWMEGVEERLGRTTPLISDLHDLLQRQAVEQSSHLRFISLNQRSLVGGITRDGREIATGFLERLLDALYGGAKAQEIWSPCRSCSAQRGCRVLQAAQVFGPESLPSAVPDKVRRRARQRLFQALQAVHLRGETHITVRELRAAVVYILFGVHFCDDYHRGEFVDGRDPLPYWDRAFAADSPARQGEVLRELARFDPALESHPQIDRYLQSREATEGSRSAPRYPELTLESARRRAFFEWTETDLRQVLRDTGGPLVALDLAGGGHIREFRSVPFRDSDELIELTRRLCAGISRLEDLPPQAFQRPGVVPLRITPRTPTETAFWVEKPLANFRIEPVLPPESEGTDRLHRQVALIYRYRDGKEERLLLGADLFHLLLELADGYQLGDVSTDDTFAHLSIFVRRLVREDERELLAWNPMDEDRIYRVTAVIRDTEDGPRQKLVIGPIAEGEA